MEILAGKLAEILEITLEKAIELYPVIRGQFVTYKILDSMWGIPLITWVGSLITGLVGIITYMEYKGFIGTPKESYKYEQGISALQGKKMAIISAIIFVIGVFGAVALNILQYTLASDFMMIKELL